MVFWVSESIQGRGLWAAVVDSTPTCVNPILCYVNAALAWRMSNGRDVYCTSIRYCMVDVPFNPRSPSLEIIHLGTWGDHHGHGSRSTAD